MKVKNGLKKVKDKGKNPAFQRKNEQDKCMEKRDDVIEADEIRRQIEHPQYQLKCQSAIRLVELKIQMISQELAEEYNRMIISSLTNRVKTADSIRRKLFRKGYEVSFASATEHLNDLIGVRATCFFEDDIYEIVKRLSAHKDVKVMKAKDYIRKPKNNGYHSFHLIVKVPVYTDQGYEWKRVEIQFRTVAMDFWAQLDYQLCYKREIDDIRAEDIRTELEQYAEMIAQMDQNMLRLRKEIESI